MIIQFLIFPLLFIILQNGIQFIDGMKPRDPRRGQYERTVRGNRGKQPQIEAQPTIKEMKFSFFELSILINILNKFNLKDIVNDQKHDLNEIFSEYISQHTAKSEQIVGKLKEICVYYDVMLDQLPKANFNTDENDIKLDIIKYRLKTLINEHKYNILERWGIIVNHGLSDEEKCSEAFEQLETFRQNKIENMYKSFTRINKSERNVFILWHLFGVARKLILSFIGFHSKNKYYNEKLEMICNNNNGEIEKISVADYIQSYFLFEKKAEFLMTRLKKVPIFKRKNIHFQYNGLNFVREQLLMTLKVAEKAINIIYPASFSYDDENDLEWWIPLIYHHTANIEELTYGDCLLINELKQKELQSNQILNSINKKVKNFIEKMLINDKQFLNFIKNVHKYENISDHLLEQITQECTEIIKKGNYQGGGSYQQNFDQIIQKSDELIEWGNNFDYGSNYGGEYNQGDGSYQEHYHGFGG